MTQFVFIILLYWYYYGPITVRSHFEVIQDEDTKISMDYDSLQEFDKHQANGNKFSRKSRHSKFPCDFQSAYPPSVAYLLWLENDKRFPKWVYDMARSKYHDDNLEWRINELSKLYRKCDLITGGFPLSGIYIRHLLELITLQKRIDDHSIIQDINTKRDLDYLKSVHLPKANNSIIKLHLKDEDEILKKVDPMGYLKVLARRSPPVRNILYKKYLNILQNNSYIDKDKTLNNTKQYDRSSNRLQRRNVTKRRLVRKKINTTKSERQHIIVDNYNPMDKMQNIIDLIEDPGLNVSKSLREELRQVCKDYLNNYLEETYNLTKILKQLLVERQLNEDIKYKKLSDWDQPIERKGTKGKEIDTFYSDDDDNKNKKYRKYGNNTSEEQIISKNINEIKIKNITTADTVYRNLNIKSSVEDESKKKYRFNKFTKFIENTRLYKKIKKKFSENYLLSKYDLIDVLENIGFELPSESKQELIYLYGELLKNNQKTKLKEVFNEQNFNVCFPNLKYEAVMDMLNSLMLCNINVRRYKNRPKLANVLENLGFNMTKSAKKKINKLYLTKIQSLEKMPKPVFT
ncbi:uncharacterized protein [Halyomorpha halys]|uniref:uncharacterized protein n=1 Tax=Halyomorpha halys TaxID=286706 RepID=UPI0006D52717|nr:uncharacterized protein LOC106691751 [Halyomorpha halys]